MDGKTCTKCGEFKALGEFGSRTRKDGSPGLYTRCKTCINAANKMWRVANPEKHKASQRSRYNSEKAYARVKEWRTRPGNKERKNATERSRRSVPEVAASSREYNRRWQSDPVNRERHNANRRQQRRDNPARREAERAAQREYYRRADIMERERAKRKIVNADPTTRAKFNARRRQRYASDPDFLCAAKCRSMVVRVAEKAYAKKDGKTIEILGYSPGDLRGRMECQFRDGMSWDNYGDWHIDHKKPIAAFIAQGITSQRTINMLCNLQPMWAAENQKKSASWPIPANDNLKEHAHAVA